MNPLKIPTPFLLLWCAFSVVIVAIGIGFNGGSNDVFAVSKDSLVDFITWTFGWFIVVAPFVLGGFRLWRKMASQEGSDVN